MKNVNHPRFFAVVVLITVTLLHGCKKPNTDENIPTNPSTPGGPTVSLAETVSNHLQFFNASKKQGTIPMGPSASSLRISLEDTLYLFDELRRPIKFLHLDKSKNVAGVFLQLSASNGAASFYYDVPEESQMKDSDTVSMITIGIDPEGLSLPENLDITIVPYDENRQPISETKKPVQIDKPKKNNGSGSCGLVLDAGEYWEWEQSIIKGGNNDLVFYSDPFKVHSAEGQYIEGSCCFGKSLWPEFCVGELKHNSRLLFATYYQIQFETFRFYHGGAFLRQTLEDSPVPLPAESNFCSGGSGKVKASVKHTFYEGDFSFDPTRFPPNPPIWLKGDSITLNLRGTSVTGTGYGNPGGIIHQLDCKTGSLVLVQADREGGNRHLIKFYQRRKAGEPRWYSLK